MCVSTSAVSPSIGEVDSNKPVNLPRTNGARGFWLSVYYVHSNYTLLLRKDDTPGHSLTRHAPTAALTSALRPVKFYPTLLLYLTADMKRIGETSYTVELKRLHFRLLYVATFWRYARPWFITAALHHFLLPNKQISFTCQQLTK